MNKNLTIATVVFILGLAAFQFFKPEAKVEKPEVTSQPVAIEEEKEIKKMNKPELTINQSKEYFAVLDTTEGEIKIKLNTSQTPITSNNFVYLANSNFYDNTIFHRVISGFMIQGGDPEGTGRGGPGYKFDDEEFEGEYKRGIVAMANAGPNTNGSQFFIMHQDYPLPPNYVIFGEVVEGLETVDKIATAPVEVSATGEMSNPVEPVIVQNVTIIEN